MESVVVGKHYQHKKSGGCYIVLAIARVEATLEPVVVYRAVDKETWNILVATEHTWTRPLTEFLDGRFEPV